MAKKRDRKKLNEKIILFPNLEKKLLDKGQECLQQKNFTGAITYFEQALALDPENSDIHIGLILSYFESGLLSKSKNIAVQMLQKGIGNYNEVMDLYLMILVQLHQYDEIITTIEALLEEREIPKEKYEYFSQMLQFSRKMAETKVEVDEKEPEFAETSIVNRLELSSIKNQQEQIQIASKLAELNINPYFEEIKEYLQGQDGDPFFKTLLLNVLTEHEITREIMVEKLGRRHLVNPSELPALNEQPQLQRLMSEVSSRLEHEDPILLEHIHSLVMRHFFILYPFNLERFDEAIWASAYIRLAAEYQGIQFQESVLNVAMEEEVKQGVESLRRLEEISFSNF